MMTEENKGFEYAKFKGHRCFKNEWAGFEKICPINVIIGRNNSGKSALLELVDAMASGSYGNKPYLLRLGDTLTLKELHDRVSHTHARNTLEETYIEWEMLGGESIKLDYRTPLSFLSSAAIASVENSLMYIVSRKKHLLNRKIHRRIHAERDIRLDHSSNNLGLSVSGGGATNICRRYITSVNEKYPRSLIQNTLLIALNYIFGKDATFTEIQTQQHDEETDGNQDEWEIFLHEETKGLIPLTKSGSGLKTVILVLLNLLVVPAIEKKEPSEFVFSFEELENNLHPSLQRRLFAYIRDFAVKNRCHIFLTTHSNVVLDIFAGSEHAQILHVEHDGESATVKTVDAYFDQLNVVNDLGAKASDLLQANGIVWLEGPSDRIYFNKWIELYTDGKLKDSVDYQCAFFGGSILAHYSAKSNPTAEIDLLRINPNAVLITDGDRTAKSGKGSGLKRQVIRIRDEIKGLPKGHAWVTDAKEIESYIPPSVLKEIWGKSVPRIGKYDPFATSTGKGYFPRYSSNKTFNKVAFAQRVISELTVVEMKKTFEWEEQMERIVETIQLWNER